MEESEQIRVKQIKHPDIADYYISKTGQVYDKDFIEKKQHLINGYYTVNISDKHYLVHRLVALTYIKHRDDNLVVNHIDSDKLNNNLENLEWITQKDNCNKHGKTTSHERRVVQMDLKGNIIAIHDSVTKAGKATNLSRTTVGKACIGTNLKGGRFTWKYENDEHNHEKDVDLTGSFKVTDYSNYHIFSDGRIYNVQRKKFLKPIPNSHGSNYITLSNSNGKQNKYIHNLVATYFIPNPNNCKYVCHIDNDKNNNNYTNLKWYN